MQNRNYTPAPKRLGNDYPKAFNAWLRGGAMPSAITYEAIDAAGGAAIPVTVDQNIVGLTPPDSAVRRLARVITTERDVIVPYELTAGVPAKKSESGATLNYFVNTTGTIGGTRMGAHMIGAELDFSREIFDDAPYFTTFAVGSLQRSQQAVEEAGYISGSGIGEAQGLLGNVGAGITSEPDAAGNMVTVSGLVDLIGTLKAGYLANASFLMNRATATNLRKSQLGVPGEPLFTREGGQEYCLGFPVEFSAAMPLAARGATPVIFGAFDAAYLIADRIDSTLKLKVLDQDPVKAVAGVVSCLVYRRGDGRVSQPEAVQQLTIAAS